MKYKICKLEKSEFPDKLKNIKKSPKQLYFIGNIKLLYEDSFAVIGTRNITKYGIKNCKFFSKELVLRNIPIVSGMAIGTDAMAHQTALDYSGKTIAVLGGGLEKIFPPENYNLFERIIKNDGLVLTEYENNLLATKEHFPLRNRIVSAISEGVLVIEAGYRSGTSITIRYAREQEKLVFAIPGRIDSVYGVGVNKIIKEGAILTTSIEDILVNYPQFMNRKCKKDVNKIIIKKEYKKIYNLLEKGESTIDQLLTSTNYSIKEILELLLKMELENIVTQEMGVYKIKD